MPLDDSRQRFAELADGNLDTDAVDKSRRLSTELRRIAQARGALFADAGGVAQAGGDGVHLSVDSQERVAELIAAEIKEALIGS